MAVAVCGAVGVVAALRAHHLVELLLHQLVKDPQPDTDRQREQSLLRGAGELAERFLHTRGQRALRLLLSGRDGRDRYVALHGGSSFDLCRITAHAASGSGRGGGTAVFKFYELRDILDEQDDASTAPLLLCAMSGAAALPLRAGAMR